MTESYSDIGWYPIETAPKDGQFIDGYNAYNGTRHVSHWNETWAGLNTKWVPWTGNWGDAPTHWKPLPQIAKETK